jgi:hypothetical protein
MAGHTITAILNKYPTFDLEDPTDDVATYIAKFNQPKTQTNAMEALGLMAAIKPSAPTLKGAPIDPMTSYVNAVKSSLLA